MDHTDITLRPCHPDEVEALRLIEKSARSRYAGLDGFDAAAHAPSIAADRFSAGDTIVAEIGGQRSGYVLMQPLDGMMYVASIMVLPAASGRGVGAALLGAARSGARAHGHAGVTLTTFRSPRWNGPWFRKHGFAPMPEDRLGPGLRAILARHATFLDMSKRETLWQELARERDGVA